MARGKFAVAGLRRRKRRATAAEGFRLGRKRLTRQMIPTLLHSLSFARRDRRNRKRAFRSLWITRLNAACRMRGVTYAQFVRRLRTVDVQLDRKHLADLAVNDTQAFDQLMELVASAKN